MRTRPVASGPGTVGPTMPLLALHRKDSGRTIPSARPKSAKSPFSDRSRAPRRRYYGLIVAATGRRGPILTRTCTGSPCDPIRLPGRSYIAS